MPLLTDKPSPGSYRVDYVGGDTKPTASRESVALFILKELAENEHVHDAPVVNN